MNSFVSTSPIPIAHFIIVRNVIEFRLRISQLQLLFQNCIPNTLMISYLFFLAFHPMQNHGQSEGIEQEEGCCVPYFIISSFQLPEQ